MVALLSTPSFAFGPSRRACSSGEDGCWATRHKRRRRCVAVIIITIIAAAVDGFATGTVRITLLSVTIFTAISIIAGTVANHSIELKVPLFACRLSAFLFAFSICWRPHHCRRNRLCTWRLLFIRIRSLCVCIGRRKGKGKGKGALFTLSTAAAAVVLSACTFILSLISRAFARNSSGSRRSSSRRALRQAGQPRGAKGIVTPLINSVTPINPFSCWKSLQLRDAER